MPGPTHSPPTIIMRKCDSRVKGPNLRQGPNKIKKTNLSASNNCGILFGVYIVYFLARVSGMDKETAIKKL